MTEPRVRLATVGAHPLSLAEVEALVADDAHGATVSFGGIVRDHDGGRGVTALGYTAHPSAQDVLGEVAAEIAAEHPLVVVAVAHRVGPLVVGDVALAAAVSSAHRAAAFAACGALIDRVKERTPIWKEQTFDDGATEWVGSL